MRFKKQISFTIVILLVLAMFATGCSKKTDNTNDNTNATPTPTVEDNKGDTGSTDTAEPTALEPMVLEVYSQPANFQGEQPGWFAKVLKDKFNVTLNIIAPQVAGGDIFAARSAAGFLGDIVILDNADIQACIKSGLIYDVTEGMKKLTSFEEFKTQLDAYNSSLEGAGEGKYFAWPTEMANTSPTTFTPTIPQTAPTLLWDYYAEVGAPEINNLSDLVKTLRAIQDKHPTNEDGEPSYGITMWPDWDGTSIENVNQLTKWYGQEVNSNAGSVLLDASGKRIPLTDDNGAYHKILQFYFEANQAGIVDPDSGTQNWDSVWKKFASKRAFLIWNDWQQGFWNTTDRGNNGENFIMAPIKDMNIYQPSDPFFGSGRAFAVGTNDPAKQERVMMLFDWMSSPDGLELIHGGIEGFIYEDAADGNGFVRTKAGETALMDNSPVPEEFGGGLYADGMNQMNQWMVASIATNTNNNTTYNSNYWPAEVEKAKTTTTKEWAERFSAENPVDYLLKTKTMSVVPFVNVSLEADPTDIALIRSNCGQLVKDASWKMVFAKDQAEFDATWNNLKEELEGFDWTTLVEFDTKKLQVLVDERAKAVASN
jgi:multiple sugar transport system substrate-binding protein/putative aldouronate transport system substrate-binding protein